MGLKSKYFLLFNYDHKKGWHIRLPLPKLAAAASVLPLFGFIFCIVWSLMYHFEETTFTHCKVWNFLPSISAAIGNHLLQYIVWCTTITLHMPARFLFILLYYGHNLKLLQFQKQYLAKMICILNAIENFSLLGLTYVTSSSAYEYHEKFFMVFMVTSELYMLSVVLMLKYATNSTAIDKNLRHSISVKTRLLIVNALSFIIAGYCFVRHNNYCEPLIYTCFAFFEYIIVLSNIGFHLTAIYDFKDQCLTVNEHGINVR